MENIIFELHASMCRIFTSSKRLEILNILRGKELSVGQIAKLMRIRQANLSQHLNILKEKGIVNTRRSGVTIYYSLANPKIIKAFDIIRQILIERLSANEKLAKTAGKKKT